MASDEVLKLVCERVKKIYTIVNKIYNDDQGLAAYNSREYFMQGPSSLMQVNDPTVFILQEYYGAPHYIHSYLGKHSITGSTSSIDQSHKRLKELLNEEFELKLIQEGDYEGGSYINKNGIKMPKRFDHAGFYGPWYQIKKLGSEEIITPDLCDRKDCYKCKCRKFRCVCENVFKYDDCKRIFNKYTQLDT